MRILIVTGGFVNDVFVTKYIKNNPFDKMIAADSGMEFFYRNQIKPDIVVGDFDSAKPEIVEYYVKQKDISLLHFRPEKDETDTELAIKTALEFKPMELIILGATGSRIDHLLGNIYLLQKTLKEDVICYIVDEFNRISLIQDKREISRKDQYGNFISLLPLGNQVSGVTLEGFKYPLENATLTNDNSLGISNELIEDVASIRISKGVLLLIESRD